MGYLIFLLLINFSTSYLKIKLIYGICVCFIGPKIIETLLSISDFIKLLFVREINHGNRVNHNVLEEEINLNERV